MSLKDVGIGKNAPDEINVIIEIPRGTHGNKYEMDKETGAIFLDRVTAVPMYYPYDYGYVPQTLCEDGDPLDALIVIDEPLYPGVVVPVRPVGVMYMIDGDEADEKLVCVPVDDITKDHVKEIDDLGPQVKNFIKHYYLHYKDWKKDWQGAKVEISGWGDASKAREVIQKSQQAAK
ncbi:inorganic diphosphatase [bacterium]|nr:inorganic diphosphatase [bacterium]